MIGVEERRAWGLFIVLGLFIAGLTRGLAAPDGLWSTDFEAASTRAKSEGKPLLLVFSGSDWCGWCQRLDEEVFRKGAFRAWAAKTLVPCVLDFPQDRAKVSARQRARNEAVKARFGVEGFPAVFLLSPKGERIMKTGYRPGGAAPFIARLEGAIRFHGRHAGEIATLGEAPAAKDLSRVAALFAACPEAVEALRRRLARALFLGDERNETGKRPEAAYALCALNDSLAEGAEVFLRSIARNDPRGLYQKIALARSEREFSVVAQAMQVCGVPPRRSPATVAAARAFVETVEADLPYIKVKPYAAMFWLRKAVALACIGRPSESQAAVARARRLGAPDALARRFEALAKSVE